MLAFEADHPTPRRMTLAPRKPNFADANAAPDDRASTTASAPQSPKLFDQAFPGLIAR